MSEHDLKINPIHLGLGAKAEAEPRFTGDMDWYSDYSDRHSGDGVEGRLVSMHVFTESWATWEMHPEGSEVVLCTSGSLKLIQQQPDETITTTTLGPGEYAINEPGIWHTADVENEAVAVFITAGWGTQHRPR